MTTQDSVNLFGKLLPVILDVAAMVPGLNIPVAAIKIVEDGVQLEEATYTLVTSKEAAPVRDAIAKLGLALGLHALVTPSNKVINLRPATEYPGYHWDLLWGWVKD